MTEIIDGIRHLITPVTAEDISALHIGDMFYLSGSMTTCRDVAHRRVVEEKCSFPQMSLMRTAHSIQSGIMRGRKCV